MGIRSVMLAHTGKSDNPCVVVGAGDGTVARMNGDLRIVKCVLVVASRQCFTDA